MVFTVEKIDSSARKRSYTFDEALEVAGFGRAQLLLGVLAGCSVMASINEAMGMSIILPASNCDLRLDPSEKGMIGGAIFLGIVTSSYFWGYQTDTRGRQFIVKYALLAVSVCSVISSFANDFASLMTLRFLVGVFMSAPSAAVFAYLGEFCTAQTRARMVSFAAIIASSSIIYVALIGWWVLSYDWSLAVTETFTFRPWRLLFVLYSIPGTIAGIVFFFCPESPKFLLSQGRVDEALSVLKLVYRINKGTAGSRYDGVSIRPEVDEVQETSKSIVQSIKNQTVPLLKMPYLKYLIVCCVNSISAFAIYGGLGLWYPQIMNQVFADSSTKSTEICSILQPSTVNGTEELPPQPTVCSDHVEQETFIYTTILGVFGVTYSAILALILGRVNAKTMLIFNMIVSGIAGITLQFVTNSYAVAILFCVEIIFAGMCIQLVYAIVISLFPTHVKGMAVSLINMAGRLSCFVASAVIGLLMAQNCPLAFYLMSGMLFLSALSTFFLP
ncbi:synaptic vesicle glycoprotein 2B-like [Toxorhynchites rutilus septentrionalis]|uniref:synaptic vesicle glycoprotein 2B-like n=1 Tax=Toxorhynchites rutilus septentrionalis TaxID=329112 RepID=UPI00247947FE|nr:synaptic vesicle glycoprotein 2B-like [Toxorhynchites rutilus septentrionalis]